MITYAASERLEPAEYTDFLRRSDLGAAPFYAACGMSRIEWAAGKHATEWDFFTVE